MVRMALAAGVLAALLAACSSQVEAEPESTPIPWPSRPVLMTMPLAPTATPTLEPALSLVPAPSGVAPQRLLTQAPEVSARAAVVMDETSGAVLYEKNAHARLGPASLTKIATAIVALEQGNLDDWVDINVDSKAMPGSSLMGLRPGDRFTLRDLLYGLMLPSGNDAALAIGRHISGSDAAFVDELNRLADRLGLNDTHFENPHGLSDAGHLSSAYDMAVLARYAMADEMFRALVSTTRWTADGNRQIKMSNLNPLLHGDRGVDGVKTGFTYKWGKTFVVSAVQDGHRVYVVLLGAPQREPDARALLDWAFAAHRW